MAAEVVEIGVVGPMLRQELDGAADQCVVAGAFGIERAKGLWLLVEVVEHGFILPGCVRGSQPV
jgi:hypothetical protein